jgi:glycosyltransferase involved in cell wall biosynthesis
MSSKRILLSAFACDPYYGSDEEIGWQWARELSGRGLDVTLLTRRSHQAAIERGIEETGQCRSVHFEYIDIDWLHSIVRHINRRNHLYYYAWQAVAFWRARKLHALQPFALIHHVTWYSFRQPSFMGLIGAPFYFGPVAGGDEIPPGYTDDFSFKEKVFEAVRRFSNALVRFDPLMCLTFATATRIYFTSKAHLPRVSSSAAAKAAIEFGIGCDLPAVAAVPDKPRTEHGNRLLFVGRCIGWKGMDIGLRIFAQVHKQRPSVSLTVIGDGVERKRWMTKAQSMGLGDAIEWRGWVEKNELQKIYSQYDVFFFPSLRDSGGFVVLEALQCGLPVVCFNLGGPGVVVDETCGQAVVAQDDVAVTVNRFADAVIHVLNLSAAAHDWKTHCIKRVENFTWESLIRRIYSRFLERGL